MTQALSTAVATAAQLPEREQDALAAILLEEMEAEERWSALFADSLNLLERMANEAIQDFQAGRVQPIDQLQ
jgi:methylase of polypeptide subunit release factors